MPYRTAFDKLGYAYSEWYDAPPSDHIHSFGLPNTSHAHSLTAPAPRYTRGDICGSDIMFASSVSIQPIPPKEPAMSVAQKIARERAEAKEEQRVRDAYAAFDATPLPTDDGTVIKFDRVINADLARDHPARTYTYAALYVAEIGLWYLTGRATSGLTTEELVDWMVERKIERNDVTALLEL